MTTESDVDADTRAQLIDLVRIDYETTCSLIDGVVKTSLALRGVGLTLILALLGFASDRSNAPVAICAFIAVGLFLYLYHGWIYVEGLGRAHELERILTLRYKELERGGEDDDTSLDLDVALAAHRFGQYSNFPRFKLRQLARARPKMLYIGLYGTLFGLAAAAIIYSFVT